ncbi:hypothetical protein [Verrucosispora sp. WMMD1129]|uniref:hypothetical protein n=1 Tax=Verrucosispora sp. WMMD1129 TaxID=3016093 RepID=UPI00249C0078|nr:hypothetical protein [Verrucosispora sp. WMMD1129]WFE45287.1 hypothetical protein O7624_13480 [Verrucosispora sp. WMMD1129]
MAKFRSAVQPKGVKALAWVSFGAAIIAGPLVAGMFVGDVIDTILEAIPGDWLPPVMLFLLAVLFIRDLVVDWEPNRLAIWSLLLAPSVARATNGDLGDWVEEATGTALNAVATPLQDALGTGAPIAMALAVGGAAILLAQRSIKSKVGGQAATVDVW